MTCYHAIDGHLYNIEDINGLSQGSPLSNPSDSSISFWSWCKRKYRGGHKCVTSKAAIITLFWSFIVSLIYSYLYLLAISRTIEKHNMNFEIVVYFIMALFLCFFPLAGCLGDIKFGRYKTIDRSIHILLTILVITVILQLPWFFLQSSNSHAVRTTLFYSELIMIFIFVSVIVVFNANIIQFGMDQLHDSPVDHQSLFIHWYFWTWNIGVLASQTVMYMPDILQFNVDTDTSLSFAITSVLVFLLTISLYIAHCKKRWFLIDSTQYNPYKVVYRVTKFARQHKVPVQRSAFTYCEDNVPSGLDLGKAKYGGPFTTEQVEDVKAFYGILKVLFAMGPVFFIDIAADRLLNNYYLHIKNYYSPLFSPAAVYLAELYLLGYGLLSTILIVILIPSYIYMVRPFFYHYIPGMLKRIGLGIILMVASLICIFVMDTMAHVDGNTSCIFQLSYYSNNTSIENIPHNVFVLVVPQCLSSCYNLLIYIAVYEFICSQSPHSMKGLLIGLSFAIRGVFELLSVIVLILLIKLKFIRPEPFPSCGMEYYLLNIGVGVAAIVLFVYAAKKYQYRLRDEPCHVHRYVEEYYSKLQDERLYNYSGEI